MNRKERREKSKEIDLLSEVINIIKHYFPELISKFDGLTDLRNQSYVKYNMKVIFIVRLLGLMCEIKSMNELSREFNTEETIKNIAGICELDLDEIPHHDTINDVFETIEIAELEEIRKYMIIRLIRSKMFQKYKVRGMYYHVVIDGTGLATSRKKYNSNCLVKNKTDKNGNEYQEYSTYVLEAKLVVGNMVFSMGTEFVENESENVDKQDCEIKAFKRLAKKIKKEYPRLKIIISGDALYASKPVLDICKEKGWKYIIRFKEGAIPTLYKEFTKITREINDGNESTKKDYEFVTKIEYKEYKINIIKYAETKKDTTTEFVYMTDLPITNKNIEESIVLGRKRWKIENVGFNIQKNGTFDIGHLYSKNTTAIKTHYMLIQIAHIIRQMLEKGCIKLKELKLKLKEISQLIKKTLISTRINLIVHKRTQLRFDE